MMTTQHWWNDTEVHLNYVFKQDASWIVIIAYVLEIKKVPINVDPILNGYFNSCKRTAVNRVTH